MDILQQCQIWNENDEHRKIMDALEAISDDDRTPEMDSELARAYANAADPYEPEGREMLRRAITLLKPHEEYFAGDHCWNFRMGYAYFYLDQEGRALPYFENALEARPGDEDTEEFIEACRAQTTFPKFSECFRERTASAWEAFAAQEKELRQIMDEDKNHERGDELIEKCENIFNPAFFDISFEIGVSGEKYELIFTPEGDKVKLFELVYFQQHAPKSVLEHWNFIVGRQANEEFGLRIDDIDINGDDVQVWIEQMEEENLALSVYCKKLIPFLKENEDKVWWILTTITDQVLGELSHMRYIYSFDILESEKDEEAIRLSKLPEKMKSMGFDFISNAEDYLESYTGYKMEPLDDPEADWRLDTMAGSTSCAALINGYLSGDNDFMDELHADGTVAGFFCYPLDTLREEEGSDKIFDFRDKLEEILADEENAEFLRVIGGATGAYCGYVDFIAWDIRSALNIGREFFEKTDLPWASFHTFRRDAGTVCLWKQETEPELDPETGSLLSAEDIETLDALEDGAAGYFGKMLSWLENFIEAGVQEGKFTYRQAQKDLEIALWYSFACNNLDEYRYYCKAAEWMKHSEQNAAGCAMWYYRYSVALMYCGRPEEALDYAEKGIQEEPTYPWIWLQVGKLRSHFGDKTGALKAVACGLALEPGDYEFLTLKKEIEQGVPLEQMEYHWIDPDADQTLQQGLCEDADSKQRSISCITINDEGLERFWSIFGPKPKQYTANAPSIQFPYTVNDCIIDLVFRMNEAGMSKLDFEWISQLKRLIQSGTWLKRAHPDGREAKLDSVIVELDYHIGLLYKLIDEDIYFQIFLNPDGSEQEDAFWSSEQQNGAELYTEEEMTAVEEHIQQYFGKFDHVFHELISPDIHVDICVVPPSEERDYYTLVTMGMGAHQMTVPKELAEYKLERAELAVAVPKDWKLDRESMQDERWYWPIRLLKSLARLPIDCDSWLGSGHTVENREPFAENTELCTAILISPQGTEDGSEICTLPGGEEVNFYQVIPLYADELDYKLEHDADALLEKMAGISFVVNPDRQDAMTRGTLSDDDFDGEMDDAYNHIESIEEKELPIDTITAYNHMAIYLRWCMEHDLMGEDFLKEYGEVVQKVKNGSADVDLREFIRDELDGCLFSVMFNKQGRLFTGYYYGEGDSPYYPADIDDNAFRYFGSERYHSGEFQDEAYLFIPFDEDYYQTMAKVIEGRFENWQGQRFDEDTLEPSETAEAVMEYLDCECTYFPSMADDDPIMSAHSYAVRNSAQEGYIPMLMKPDETLLECLVMNSDPENDADCYEFDLKTIAEYRKGMLSASPKDGKEVLEKYIEVRKSEAEDDDFDWEEDVFGEMREGFANHRFSSYWNSETGMTYPLILAKIPVKNPWEIFAYLPFGNWNECPDTENLMAAAKYWFEKYGAVPAVMSHDELEFNLPEPASKEDAMELAAEQYGFCPDMDQNFEQIGALADTLWQSTVWYFWWD